MKRLIIVAAFVLTSSFTSADIHITEIPLEKVQQALKKSRSSHPRLFLSDKQLPGVMRNIKASDELEILHKELIRRADDLIEKKPLERIQTGRRLLAVSREALGRLFTLSWAYRSAGAEKYLKRAEQEMLAIADFSDWNPPHFLDVAEMTTAMAIGYDWLYNDLPVESRNKIRKAVVEKGLRPSLYENENGKPLWWINTTNNWNQVCHGGMTCGALAVMEDEPKLAETIIHRSVNKVQIAMSEYEPNGAYPEGPGYWAYGTTYNVILTEAIDSVLGTDFGLSEKNGFSKSAEYYLHIAGPTGLYFNYGDCGSRGGFNSTVSWFAKKYNDPSLLWNQKKIFDAAAKRRPSDLIASRTSALLLHWGLLTVSTPERLSWMAHGRNPVAMFRSSWDDDAVYLAIKGGDTSFHHAHMDAGSFVIDADGLRWAMDLGREDYHKIETLGGKLWSRAQDGDRWKLFRYGNYSHNTLTVNGQYQRVDGSALITRYSEDSEFPHAVIDMTTIYQGQLKKAVRGASLLPSGQILIQDQLQADDKPATVRWNMVTPAKVNIKSGKSAVLSQKRKTMRFNVYSEADIKLEIYSTKPRSHLDADNGDTRMLGFDIELAPNEKITTRVVMTPGAKEKPLKGDIKNVENWSQPLTVQE
jgi:hypothetical protein